MLSTQTLHDHLRFVPSKLFTIVAVGATWFPYFQVKRQNYLQEITWEEVAMRFLHLVAIGAQVLSAGLPFHLAGRLAGRHFANYEGLNGVNRQPSNGQKINRQLSKSEYFYRQPSNERVKTSRQISQICLNDRENGVTNWWSRRFIRPAVTEVM